MSRKFGPWRIKDTVTRYKNPVVNPLAGLVDAPMWLFIARELTFSKSKPEGTEIIQQIKMTLDDATKLVMENKMADSISCVLILKANMLQSRNGN